jgi:uncharacterized protein YeaO (DUF488 family)
VQNASRIHRNCFKPHGPNIEAIVTSYHYWWPQGMGRGCLVVDAWACAIAPHEPL